jgi:hypothetical protein
MSAPLRNLAQPTGPTSETDHSTVVIGAGPYGLAATVQLRRAGTDVRTFGDCMSFWRAMPKGMLLRSNWSASNIAEPSGELSLDSFKADTGARFEQPIPVEQFIEYGTWIQHKAMPDLDSRSVTRVERSASGFTVELEDGDQLEAHRVVVACGIAPFAWHPPAFRDLPAELASHTSDHSDYAGFRGQRVAVVGGGQSALEAAALLTEAGADPEVFVRRAKLVWLRGVGIKRRLGPLGPIVYAPTDVGPLWYSRLVALPDVFRRLPRNLQTPIARRSIRPAGSYWIRAPLDQVPLHLRSAIRAAEPDGGRLRLIVDGGSTHVVDHLLLGTGYRVDVARYPFLSPEIIDALQRVDGYPVLGPGLESSVERLHFLGAPAAWSFGPIMRFVSGSWYSSRSLARSVCGRDAGPIGRR